MSDVVYSIVVPVKDEAGCIATLVAQVELTMDKVGQRWELICVDDGSTDGTRRILQEIQLRKPFLIFLALTAPRGQSAALAAGFARARGEFVITLDADLQNDPEDIPKLLLALGQNDLVCGYRVVRFDSWLRRMISQISNSIRSRLCADGMRDSGCSLKVMRAACLRRIPHFDGMHRFLPALFLMEGYRVREIAVNHRPRMTGVSKVSFYNRLLRPIVDMLAVVWMRRRRLRIQLEDE